MQQSIDKPTQQARDTIVMPVALPPVLSDSEVDDICAGLKQNAAKVRYLSGVLHVPVQRKPNGRPLVLRSDWERRAVSTGTGRQTSGPKWSKAA